MIDQSDLNTRDVPMKSLPNNDVQCICLYVNSGRIQPSVGQPWEQTTLWSDFDQFQCLPSTTRTPTIDQVVLAHCDVGDDWYSWSKQQSGGYAHGSIQ